MMHVKSSCRTMALFKPLLKPLQTLCHNVFCIRFASAFSHSPVTVKVRQQMVEVRYLLSLPQTWSLTSKLKYRNILILYVVLYIRSQQRAKLTTCFIKFYWNTGMPVSYRLSMAATMAKLSSCDRTVWPQTP